MASTKNKTRTRKRTQIANQIRKVLAENGREELLEESAEASGEFCVLPYDAEYEAQNRDEVIVFIIRQAVITLVPRALQVLLMIVAPIFVILFLSSLNAEALNGAGATTLGIVVFWYLFTLTLAYRYYLYWYYNVFIVTNQRVIDLDFDSLLSSNTSGTSNKNIEDVSVSQSNVFGNIFGFGDVAIQTAGAKREFELMNVPHPSIIQDAILDLKLQTG